MKALGPLVYKPGIFGIYEVPNGPTWHLHSAEHGVLRLPTCHSGRISQTWPLRILPLGLLHANHGQIRRTRIVGRIDRITLARITSSYLFNKSGPRRRAALHDENFVLRVLQARCAIEVARRNKSEVYHVNLTWTEMDAPKKVGLQERFQMVPDQKTSSQTSFSCDFADLMPTESI